jgi:hypothetical protein
MGGDLLKSDPTTKILNLFFVAIPTLMILGFIIGYMIGSK